MGCCISSNVVTPEKTKQIEPSKPQSHQATAPQQTQPKSPDAAKPTRTHIKCRGKEYIGDKVDAKVERGIVPNDKVPWSVEFNEYKPVEFTSIIVKNQPVWADFEDCSKIEWYTIDMNKIDRRSHEGKYKIDHKTGKPLNIVGRTGIIGRGLLGRWGPNHAADPIVTKWKRADDGKVVKGSSGKPILQFVCIQRLDTKEWAIPGGMCDPGEPYSLTLKREFMEEAANSIEKNEKSKEVIGKMLDKIFSNGVEVYKGYVDDPRNTDNAWIETIAHNFHDENGELLKDFKLEAGDDARKVKWMDIDSNLKLYASHMDFMKKVVEIHKAHW